MQGAGTTSTDPIIIVEGESTASTDPIIVLEEATTVNTTVLEQWNICTGLMIQLISELYCPSRGSSESNDPHIPRGSSVFRELCDCVELARAKSKDAESRIASEN